MAKFDFDKVIERRGTACLKADQLESRFGSKDLIPFWIADMDFLSPPAITEAIIKRAQHGVFGYTGPTQEYYDAILNWLKDYHQWNIQQEWLSFIPGIVKGIAFAIDCFSKDDEKIVIQPPVYPPFRNVPRLFKREIVKNYLILDEEKGRYEIDFDDLEKKIDDKTKILILCNPHNPGGIVWSKEDLIRLAEICYDRGVLVVADEIHADLALNGHKHTPFASVSEKAAMNSITFMAPSKTFNIAGIISSFSVVPNPELRERFNAYLNRAELSCAHIFAYTATIAAYNESREWLEEAKKYIEENIEFTKLFLEKHIPQIKMMTPEASFLIWLDCRGLGLSQPDLVRFFIDDAKLALNDGATFDDDGIAGNGYMRFNIGCPRSIIEKGLKQLKEAVDKKMK